MGNSRARTAREQLTEPGPTGPSSQPVRPERDQVVADALDDLATQIKEAASTLRRHEPGPPCAATPGHVRCDPQCIVDLVMDELSRRGIKSAFGSEVNLADAAGAAARLLEALDVTPS